MLLPLMCTLTPGLSFATPTQQLAIHPPPHLDAISLNQARSIFSMRVRVWPDGSPITVFVLNDQASEHDQFVRSILSLLPHQLRRQWDRLVYTGIGQAPIEVGTPQDMIKNLLNTPGSIGYINSGQAHEKLRIVPLR